MFVLPKIVKLSVTNNQTVCQFTDTLLGNGVPTLTTTLLAYEQDRILKPEKKQHDSRYYCLEDL